MHDPRECTVHMIGHGHIDPTWLWRWTEGYEEVRATFRSALDRMNEYPDFYFSASSACFYEWLETTEPELFAAVKQRVEEGRWEVCGGFFVEPDCNIPAGESFVRHGLYSQRYFKRAFGRRARVAFNPDSFGHAGSLPQILKKLGIEYYAYHRPSPPHEMDYPWGTTFWWEAADGTRVLAANILLGYDAHADRIPERLEKLVKSPHLNPNQKCLLAYYGVGNHGGGPTIRAIDTVHELNDDETQPTLKLSTMETYFKEFIKETDHAAIPTINTGLQHHARGCYAVHSEVKRLNRQVEHALMTAERWATAAWMLHATEYPHDAFQKAWKDLLFNQFHDILAGTSIPSSYDDTRDQLGAARHRADVITNQAIQAIARDVDTTADGNTILVFNPLTWPVQRAVTVNPIVCREVDPPHQLVDAEGQKIPWQQVRHERPGDKRYTFMADVPALGYAAYHVRSSDALEVLETAAEQPKHLEHLSASATHLENTWWRIEFDPASGCINRLYDKQQRLDALGQGAVLSSMGDDSDTWSHEVRGYRSEAGRFGQAELALMESGEVLATVRSVSRYSASTAIQEFTLYRESPHIDVKVRVNWQEQYQCLKWSFFSRVKEGVATCDIAYGMQERAAKSTEEPMQQWCDLSGNVDGQPYGLALLNDSKYAFDALAEDGSLRVTLLRSPAYAHHDDARYYADSHHPIIDQGWQTARFQIVPHTETWQAAHIVKLAWECNAALIPHGESSHPGERPPQATLFGTDTENVLLSVIKQSEDGEDLVLRGYEIAGKPAQTTLHMPDFGQRFPLSFGPHEIKTVRIDPKSWEIKEVDLLEE
jgi:alpha-mannosidase